MRIRSGILLLLLASTLPAFAADKLKGATSLKDFQPADADKKHQRFDLVFEASSTHYTCRTKEDEKLKATEWPVNSDITYEIDKDKAKVKNKKGKKVDCTIVRVDPIEAAIPH